MRKTGRTAAAVPAQVPIKNHPMCIALPKAVRRTQVRKRSVAPARKKP